MSGIDLLVEEHKYISRMLIVIRKACFDFMENNNIDYDDFDKMISFIKNFADGYHHKREEVLLFNKMVEYLGEIGKNIITHGMLVEHDQGRSYIRDLEEALQKYQDGDKEAKLDIIANAVSYTNLLKKHIEKEDNVIFNFAKRSLNKHILQCFDKETLEYIEKNYCLNQENIGILNSLEKKYI